MSQMQVSKSDRQPVVHVLVDGATPARLAHTARLFETLRVGFPTAPIEVWDNASPPAAAAEIARLGSAAGCKVARAAARLPDYAFLSGVVLNPNHNGARVVVTSALIFWASCERWNLPGLLAGHLIPAHIEDGRISRPHLSPALWWIRDVTSLRERIFRLFRGSAIGFLDPFAPSLVCDDASGVWHRYGTGANLYAALRAEAHAFTETELDCYDDPAGGPWSDAVDSKVRGLWRAQDEQYRLRAVPVTADLVFGR